jgi:hypothetical protein
MGLCTAQAISNKSGEHPMQETPLRTRWPWIAWGLIAVPGLTFLALAPYDHPFFDDFIYASDVRDKGFWPMQSHQYRGWTGRYTATALQSGIPAAFNMVKVYPAIPFVMLSTWWLSLACFLVAVNRSLGNPVSRSGVWLATFVLGAIYLAEMPSPAEGFFWLAAVATYTVPLTMSLLMFSCALAICRHTSAAIIFLASIGACLLGLISAGGNECLLPVLLASLFVAGVFALRTRHPSTWAWLAAFIGVATGAAILVLAPGNAVRGSFFHNSRLMAFLKVQPNLLKWFALSPALLGVLILAIPFAARIADRMPWTRRITTSHLVLVAAAGWCSVLLSVLPPILMGIGPAGRMLNQSYLIFMLSCCVTAFFALAWFRNRQYTLPYTPEHSQRFGWIMLVVGLLLISNVPQAAYDLAFVAVPYDHQLRARYELLTRYAAARTKDVTVDRLTHRPRTICVGNLRDEQSVTSAMGAYFGLVNPDFKIR